MSDRQKNGLQIEGVIEKRRSYKKYIKMRVKIGQEQTLYH